MDDLYAGLLLHEVVDLLEFLSGGSTSVITESPEYGCVALESQGDVDPSTDPLRGFVAEGIVSFERNTVCDNLGSVDPPPAIKIRG